MMLNIRKYIVGDAKKYIVLLAVSLLFLCSCSRYKDIEINDVDIVKVQMASMARYNIGLAVEVDNPSGLTFSITDVNGSVFRNGEKFADIIVDKPMKIRAHKVEDIPVEFTVAVSDPLALLAVGLSYKNLDLSQFTITVEGVVKWANVKKTVKFKDLSLQELFSAYVEGNN